MTLLAQATDANAGGWLALVAQRGELSDTVRGVRIGVGDCPIETVRSTVSQ